MTLPPLSFHRALLIATTTLSLLLGGFLSLVAWYDYQRTLNEARHEMLDEAIAFTEMAEATYRSSQIRSTKPGALSKRVVA